jgi:uncharacterized membrane protein YczE
MSVRLQIAALIFMMVQAVFFGLGVVLVLATPLTAWAVQLIPLVIGLSVIVSAPVAWMIAPHMRSRFGKRAAPLRA